MEPTGDGRRRAIVEALTPSPTNEIKDAELLECLRQSSFALDELKDSYSFTLSMPIAPPAPVKAP
jgi:hypothetical protein